MGAASH
jgi:hypothetical protein